MYDFSDHNLVYLIQFLFDYEKVGLFIDGFGPRFLRVMQQKFWTG